MLGRVLAMVITMLIACCWEATALDQQDLRRLMSDNACESCDFAGAEMTGMLLETADGVLSTLKRMNEKCFVIGEIRRGTRGASLT